MRAAAWTLAGVVALAATPLVAGCATPDEGGECTVKIRYDGDVYRAHNALLTPRRGEALGPADFADCAGETMQSMGQPELYAVAGEDPSVLLISHEEGGDGLYLNEDIRYRDRPAVLKQGAQFLRCTGPARFTASWRYVDPADMPNNEDYESARVPYTAVFTSRRGRGLALDRWSKVTLEAEITSETDPVPSVKFLEDVLAGNAPVAVTARCRGQEFVVTSIRIATTRERGADAPLD